MDKSPDAFRTISEVAEDLDLPQHVLRFWETRFSQIKPLKRGGGRRYYRPDDVELLRAIRHLLYGEGYTIRGVQRLLKEQGPKGVAQIAAGAPVVARPQAPHHERDAPPLAPPPRHEPLGLFDEELAVAPAPVLPVYPADEEQVPPEAPHRIEPMPPVLRQPEPNRTAMPGIGAVDSPLAAPSWRLPENRLSADNLQRLQAALFEIEECKRVLEDLR